MERGWGAYKERARSHGGRMNRDILHAVGRRDGGLENRRAYLVGQGMEMVEACWVLRDAGMRLHG